MYECWTNCLRDYLAMLYWFAVKRVGFGIRVFIAMISGIAFGIVFKEQSSDVGAIGQNQVRQWRLWL